LKELCHKTLAILVGTEGTIKISEENLKFLVKSSVEPDNINRELIANDILNVLIVPIEWLVDHGIKAKELAIRCIMEASNAFKKGDNIWPKYLGWAFHFIADWGTPHHAPFSRSNPIPSLMGAGLIIGGLLGGLSKAGQGLDEVLKGIAKGVAIGGGITGAAALVGLVIKHNEFEKFCDKHIEQLYDLTVQCFKKETKTYNRFNDISQALSIFNNEMDKLRYECNNLSSNWIFKCTGTDFAEYLAKIAYMMNMANTIVIN